MDPPSRDDRKKCWRAKDSYFACLGLLGNNKQIVKTTATRDNDSLDTCETVRKAFEESCPASWYIYFMKKRDMDLAKAEMIKRLEKENTAKSSWK